MDRKYLGRNYACMETCVYFVLLLSPKECSVMIVLHILYIVLDIICNLDTI